GESGGGLSALVLDDNGTLSYVNAATVHEGCRRPVAWVIPAERGRYSLQRERQSVGRCSVETTRRASQTNRLSKILQTGQRIVRAAKRPTTHGTRVPERTQSAGRIHTQPNHDRVDDRPARLTLQWPQVK